MPLYYSYGKALVNTEELNEKRNAGEFEKFAANVENGKDAAIEFSTGKFVAADITAKSSVQKEPTRGAVRSSKEERSPFSDVGINKPLSIEIRHVYTGKYPEKTFFGRKKDMLVTSAMKSIVTYDAAQRALNYLMKDIGAKSGVRIISASEQGTPLIFYSPALTQTSSILTLEFIFDTFPNDLFEKISNGFKATAGIPIFASASFYLLAAGTITKMIGGAGESIFDGNTAFKATEEISFERPGSKIPVAGYRLMTQHDFDSQLLKEYSISDDGILVNGRGEPYNGDYPYIVISLDGKENTDYNNFLPTATSAGILDRFYSVKEGKETSIDMLVDALKLYNDLSFRKKADDLNNQLAGLDKNSAQYQKIHDKYLASLANIDNPIFKPK